MRILASLVILLFAAPYASALLAPAPAAPALNASAPVSPALVPAFPADVRDADVLMLLAAKMGLHPTRLPIPTPAPGVDVPLMVTRLGERAHLAVSAEDAAAFRALDPQIAAPVLVMLVAIDQAWAVRDEVFADVTEEEMIAWRDALDEGTAPPTLLTPEQFEMLVNQAILLSDTMESVLIPQLNAAADAGVWPPIPIADPVGVLRIGSAGDDVETIDRILQVDGRGNDTYYNNAGGTTLLWDTNPLTPDYAITASLDLAGDDDYLKLRFTAGQGGASFGVGLLYDSRGDDFYGCSPQCMGSANVGVGILRDAQGAEEYWGSRGIGWGNAGLGYARDDSGDDEYYGGYETNGAATNHGTGVFWDRAGVDTYSSFANFLLWGWAESGGRGWYVDEGQDIDTWEERENHDPVPRVCNNCIWTGGSSGHANDNYNGLAYLLAYQAS